MRERSDTKAKTADHGHWPLKFKIMKYYIEANYGYGDIGITESNLNKSQAIKKFNKEIRGDLKTILECLNYEHTIFTLKEHI